MPLGVPTLVSSALGLAKLYISIFANLLLQANETPTEYLGLKQQDSWLMI